MNTQAVRPSGWFYMLGFVVILVGLGIFGYFLGYGIMHITDNLRQVVVPGEKDLTLQANLNYTIFVENQSEVNGKIYATKTDLNGLTCRVTSQASGKRIGMRQPAGSTTYHVGARSGRSVLEFKTEEAGTYHLSCSYPEGSEGEQVMLAVGSGLSEEVFGSVFKALGAFFLGTGLGAVLLAIVFVMRDRAKRRLTHSATLPMGGSVQSRY